MGVCARGDGLKKWEEGYRLLLVDGLPAVSSDASPSGGAPSLRNGMESSAGDFPCLTRNNFFRPLSGVLPGPVLQMLIGTPNHSRSGLGPSLPPPFSSADETDGSMTQNNFFADLWLSPANLHAKGEDPTNELTIRMAVASL